MLKKLFLILCFCLISNFANSASVLKHSIFGDANCVDVDEIESIMRNEGTKIQRR